jgi:hypothetical protein
MIWRVRGADTVHLEHVSRDHRVPRYPGRLQDDDESIRHDETQVVQGAMHRSSAALTKKHKCFNADEHARYIHKIEARFKNLHIRDDVKRVWAPAVAEAREGG